MRLAIMSEITAALIDVNSIEDIFRLIAQKMPLLLSSDWVALLINERTHFCLYWLDEQQELVTQKLSDPPVVAMVDVLNGNQIKMISDINTLHPEEDARWFADHALRSVIMTPLAVRDQRIGTLSVGRHEAGDYDLSDEKILQQAAMMFVMAIDHWRIEQAASRRAQQLEKVLQISRAISTLDYEALFQTVINLTKHNFDLYHAHIYLLDEAEEYLELAAGADEVGQRLLEQAWRIPLNHPDSLVAQAAQSRTACIVDDVLKNPVFLPNPDLPDTRSEMAVPILFHNQLLGVLDLQSEKADYFTTENLLIQETLAAQIAIAIENVKLLEETNARAQREQVLRQITAKIGRGVDVKTVIRTSAQELGQLLGRKVMIRLDPEKDV